MKYPGTLQVGNRNGAACFKLACVYMKVLCRLKCSNAWNAKSTVSLYHILSEANNIIYGRLFQTITVCTCDSSSREAGLLPLSQSLHNCQFTIASWRRIKFKGIMEITNLSATIRTDTYWALQLPPSVVIEYSNSYCKIKQRCTWSSHAYLARAVQLRRWIVASDYSPGRHVEFTHTRRLH